MRLLLILATIIISKTSADRKCTGVYFGNAYYDVDIIKDGINKIHNMVLNNVDNNLYFTFDQIAKVPTRVLGYLNLNTRKAGLIEGVRNATTLTLDPRYNVVYVGGSEGIYVVNNLKIEQKLPINDNIRSIFFKDVLYYSNNRKESFKYANGYFTLVQELQGIEVDTLIVDDDNNIFFLQKNKLFRVKMGTRAINSHESYNVDVVTTDVDYKPYVVANDGTYVYNKYKYALDKVSFVRNLKALTFNKMNEPIYAVEDAIVKLKYNSTPCREDKL